MYAHDDHDLLTTELNRPGGCSGGQTDLAICRVEEVVRVPNS
jgi:hypothetical protein